MGSLMAGWDSPVLGDESKVRRMRNRSMTNEEVESWSQQHTKPAAEDNGETIISPPPASPGAIEKRPFGSSQRRRSPTTSPLARGDKIVDAGDGGAAGGGESPSKSRDWWTRSNWAFLNEPPLEEEQAAPGTAQSYAPQFHVAAGRIATGNA